MKEILTEIKQDIRGLSIKVDDIHTKVVKSNINGSWFKLLLTLCVGWLAFLTKVIFNIKIY